MKSYLTRVWDKKIRNGYITWETRVAMWKIWVMHCEKGFNAITKKYPHISACTVNLDYCLDPEWVYHGVKETDYNKRTCFPVFQVVDP